jgi:hypothetical protein
MKRLIAWLLLTAATAAPSHAGLIAFADGVATGGCNDCGGVGIFDPFGLGPAADLANVSFRVIYEISDAALATAPRVTSSGSIRWDLPEDTGYLTASLEIANTRYTLPQDDFGVVMPYFEYLPDGNFSAHFQNERMADSAFTYSHLSATGNGSVFFKTWRDVFEPGGTNRSDWRTSLFGNIGAFTIQPTNVPEPGTLALLGTALLGLALSRRRKAH